MTVTIQIAPMLRDYCDLDASEVLLTATSVRDALRQLQDSHPAVYRSVCDETGRVRRHVNLFVNTSHIRNLDGLDTPLNAGDLIVILPAVSGG